jgi:branched-chain amino acid transport system substrate-binding protein
MSRSLASRLLRRLAGVVLVLTTLVYAGDRALAQPEGDLSVAVVLFLSGPAAAHFGIPARNGAELAFDALNAGSAPPPYDVPGFGGRTVAPEFVDEAGGATKQVAEFRNLVQRRGVDLVMGYISSGDCLAIPQVAEELAQLTILVDCGTPRVFEEARYHYVFRFGPTAVMDNVAAARYLLDRFPEVSTIAGLNQNYAWGQDSWTDFEESMRVLKPAVKIVDAQFPRLFAGQFGAEISSLLAEHPDVIHTSFWGADLEALVNQGVGRGLFQRSLLVLSVGEHVLPRIGDRIPDGTIVGARGPHGDFAPPGPLNDWFRKAYVARYGIVPNHPAYKTAMAVMGLKTALDKAAAQAGGAPDQDQMIAALEYLEWDSPSGKVKLALADGHQAISANAIGRTHYDPALGRVTVEDVVVYPAECVNPPPGIDGLDWIKQGFPGAKCD